MWENKWKVRWIRDFTWDCSSSKAKFKINWCYYLTALEDKNYMPIRKDRCWTKALLSSVLFLLHCKRLTRVSLIKWPHV